MLMPPLVLHDWCNQNYSQKANHNVMAEHGCYSAKLFVQHRSLTVLSAPSVFCGILFTYPNTL